MSSISKYFASSANVWLYFKNGIAYPIDISVTKHDSERTSIESHFKPFLIDTKRDKVLDTEVTYDHYEEKSDLNDLKSSYKAWLDDDNYPLSTGEPLKFDLPNGLQDTTLGTANNIGLSNIFYTKRLKENVNVSWKTGAISKTGHYKSIRENIAQTLNRIFYDFRNEVYEEENINCLVYIISVDYAVDGDIYDNRSLYVYSNSYKSAYLRTSWDLGSNLGIKQKLSQITAKKDICISPVGISLHIFSYHQLGKEIYLNEVPTILDDYAPLSKFSMRLNMFEQSRELYFIGDKHSLSPDFTLRTTPIDYYIDKNNGFILRTTLNTDTVSDKTNKTERLQYWPVNNSIYYGYDGNSAKLNDIKQLLNY